MQYTRVLEFYRKVVGMFGGIGLAGQVLVIVAGTVLTSALGIVVVVLLPVDHFSHTAAAKPPVARNPVAHGIVMVFKNVLGLAILPLGILMALPLVPGPGMVFILIGLSLLDFPGKRVLERKLLTRPMVLRFLNGARTYFHKPPLVIDAD